MDYRNCSYKELIEYAQSLKERETSGNYYEKHHILPRFMGGLDSEVVLLTLYEHVLAHWLLAQENKTNRRIYYGNIIAASMIFSHDGPDDPETRSVAIKDFLEKHADLKEVIMNRMSGKHVYPRNIVIWAQLNNQKPMKFDGEFYTKESLEQKGFTVILNCPVCHKENSKKSYACCKEHRKSYEAELHLKMRAGKAVDSHTMWQNPEIKARISASISAAYARRRALKEAGLLEEKVWITNGITNAKVDRHLPLEPGWRLGRTGPKHHKPHSEETRAKMRGRNGIGKYVHKDGVVKRAKTSEELQEYLTNGWELGNPNAATRAGDHRKQTWRKKRTWINNGVNCRMIAPDEEIPFGWTLGKGPIGVSHAPKNAGRKWFTNGSENKMAFECPEGFHPGKIQREPKQLT